MRIAIGCDHWGTELKQTIIKLLTDRGHKFKDLGCYTTDPVDYPDIAKKVGEAVARGDFDRGILICNNGVGMCMFNARHARQHQDANILCLGAGEEQVHDPVSEIVDAFLTTDFEGGRHQRRIDKIKAMEG
jgi:ribose 5-phosphate isomerase B